MARRIGGGGPVTGGPRRAVITGTRARTVRTGRAATPSVRTSLAGPRGVTPPMSGGAGRARTTSALFSGTGATINKPKSGPTGRIPAPRGTGASKVI